MITRSANTAFVLFTLLILATRPARASLFSLEVSGTISSNSSSDSTIPIDTPWTFELTFDTAAPDLDFDLTGSPDPTFGRFTNTAAPPALTFFHYQAGEYEVTIDEPADFGTFSEMIITFSSVNAIDINIQAPDVFPPLAGGPVSFHADFNRFTAPPIFSSDALPTNTALSPESFDQSTVSLLLPAGGAVSGSIITSLTLTAVPDVPGDFNLNGVLDSADIDELSSAIRNMSVDITYDLNQDGAINADDRETWVVDLKRTFFGDSDLNGELNSSDLVLVFAAGRYETPQQADWASGDWNGDGRFNSSDLIAAFAEGGYEQGPRPDPAVVPEPAAGILLVLGTVAWACREVPRLRHLHRRMNLPVRRALPGARSLMVPR